MSGPLTIPDRLERASELASEMGMKWLRELHMETIERIEELELAVLHFLAEYEPKSRADELAAQVAKLRQAILVHRGVRGNWIGYEPCDQKLWEQVADVPHHDIKGDG